MNAIKMLELQHREVANLFEKIEQARKADTKERYFIQLADSLAIHATIEEHHFYPAVREKRTEDILLESLEEHLAIKRVLSDLLDVDIDDETFDAKLAVLKEEVEHHVEEEEKDLFPKVKKVLDEGQLEAIAQAMTAEQNELEEKGNPRDAVPGEVDKAAPL
jgi:hemerythrin superfamily protein